MRQFLAKLLGVVLLVTAVAPAATRAGTVAVLAALDKEMDALKREIELVGRPLEFDGRTIYQARFGGKPVLLAKTGASPNAVAPLIQWLVSVRSVDAVISIGPAGALSDRVEVGEVLILERAVRDVPSAARNVFTLTQVTNCDPKPAGTIVTANSFVANQGERVRLHVAYGADAVDMSAAVLAEACESRHVPCVIIRQITDRADENAPQSFTEVVRSKHPFTVSAALCALGQLTGRLSSKGPS